MIIIGLSGLAGSGKDTAASFIVNNYNFVSIALADPMKRFCKEVYGFSVEQLWGESELRNQPDRRLPKPGRQAEYARILISMVEHNKIMPEELEIDLKQIECDGWLTPRELLQKTAGDWGRSCYEDTWIDYGLSVANHICDNKYSYDKVKGLIENNYAGVDGVIISDCRYINEIAKIKSSNGKMIRILGGTGLQGDYAKHLSESEQKQIPNSVFDFVVINDGSIEDLEKKISGIMKNLL